ncbi:DUF2238 domain-containing protein [Vibrio olivae]|uniref:DUF2238 domain-containing protein n=1 Tax=Vibrio olivae TaxID=1243002 RepID=A0ABV5HTL8_9VIBR
MKQTILWLAIFCAVLVWSAIDPYDRFTWFLEVVPALIGVFILAITYSRFPLTPLLYSLILLHCIILMVGGHYTYAKVPLFDDIKQWFDLARNNYDKLGHFAQGFVPAIIVREIVIRRDIIRGRGWQHVFSVAFCLAFSAFYELVEWWVAVATGDNAQAFLGTQGYVWDTQSDMAYALVGAIVSVMVLSRWHDKQINKISSTYA